MTGCIGAVALTKSEILIAGALVLAGVLAAGAVGYCSSAAFTSFIQHVATPSVVPSKDLRDPVQGILVEGVAEGFLDRVPLGGLTGRDDSGGDQRVSPQPGQGKTRDADFPFACDLAEL